MTTLIDPYTSLAFSVYSQKGVFALLLGSGISQAAAIPTGWDITKNLIVKLAAQRKEDAGPEPDKWYKNSFGEEPDYSKLLRDLSADNQSIRQQLLKPYFEPTEEEEESGLKRPTKAHYAVAKLMRDGYIRAVLTTNFDRLLETALSELGISPRVVSTDDGFCGMNPLSHSNHLIVKLHGDYHDARIKNTPDELANYSPAMKEFLSELLRDFGLIVCGWSAKWDLALRDAICANASRRFPIYFAYRGKLQDEALSLCTDRNAITVKTSDANEFFVEIQERIEALGKIDERNHPLSPEIAAARMKKILSRSPNKVEAWEMLLNETRKLESEITGPRFDLNGESDKDAIQKRLAQLDSSSQALIRIAALYAYWAEDSFDSLIEKVIGILGDRINLLGDPSTKGSLWGLAAYPATLIAYSAGIAALSSGKHKTLHSVLWKRLPQSKYRTEDKIAAISLLCDGMLFNNIGNVVVEFETKPSPLSWHIEKTIRPAINELIGNEADCQRYFDQFEIMVALIGGNLPGRTPTRQGCYWYRERFNTCEDLAMILGGGLIGDLSRLDWFGGDSERGFSLIRELEEFVRKNRESAWRDY